MRKVYLDYSATTPVKDEVVNEMVPFLKVVYGNPSSLYSTGVEAKEALEEARGKVSDFIGAEPREVFFTSSGTEADNWALISMAQKLKDKGNHIITTKIEHHAILHTGEYLEKQGFEVTYLDVKEDGIIDLGELEKAITDKTILISIMYANNEIGTVQPIKEAAAIAKAKKVLFHTDAVQALGNMPIDVKDLGVDMMSISAHKIYGPKGVGALYVRRGVNIPSFMHGGAQENKKRAGTENLVGIVGFGKACEVSKENLSNHISECTMLRDYFIDEITDKIPDIKVNGSMDARLPGNANVTFRYIEGEALLLMLDMKGISISTGSACSSASLTPSHVLSAIGVPVEDIHGSLRFTVGDFTTKEDIDYTVEALVEVVAKLREISAVSKDGGW